MDIANSSKHIELNAPAKVVFGDREVSSWYSYFFAPPTLHSYEVIPLSNV